MYVTLSVTPLSVLKLIFILLLILQSSRYSKLEKADILEMTVKHLRSVQRQQISGMYTIIVLFSYIFNHAFTIIF